MRTRRRSVAPAATAAEARSNVDGSGTFVGKEGDLVTGACFVSFKGHRGPPYLVSAGEIEEMLRTLDGVLEKTLRS